MSSTPAPPPGEPPLHAVHVLGSASGGGAAVRSLAAGLVARGLRVTVCAPRPAGEECDFTGAGASFAPLWPPADALAVAGIRAASSGADVVHAHGLRPGALAALALRGRPTPLVVTWQPRGRPAGARERFTALLERRVARAAAVVLGATSDLVDRARLRGARDARLAPVAVPVPRPAAEDDEARRHKTRAELGAVARPLLLGAGPLEPDEGHGTLLDAARDWRALDPEPLLVVAGEGRERARLRRRVELEELSVRLLGRRDDVPELLAAADAVITPGRWESGFPLAQQALSAGVPLVATAVGGIPELVGPAAELVPYGDAGALSRAVARLLTEPGRSERLVARGLAQAATWPSEDDAVAHVLSVYDELARR
ncbi:glycosyltransferase family 4 protein [Streptomyces gamaensis]|uniref:D-inositol 3-phosphate glycosyltransferase n=1 Tax=Streptomyces gamaensis TaxID=1763542 RepID=A0ABW0ZAT1_9ACTN